MQNLFGTTDQAFYSLLTHVVPGGPDHTRPPHWWYAVCLGSPPYENMNYHEPTNWKCVVASTYDDPDLQAYVDAGAPFYTVSAQYAIGDQPDILAPARYTVDCLTMILVRGGYLTPNMLNRLVVLDVQDDDLTPLLALHLPDNWRQRPQLANLVLEITHPLLYAPFETFCAANPCVYIRPDRPALGAPYFPLNPVVHPPRMSYTVLKPKIRAHVTYVNIVSDLEEGELDPNHQPTAPLGDAYAPMAMVTTPVSFDLPAPHATGHPTPARSRHQAPQPQAPLGSTPPVPAAGSVAPHMVVPITRSRSRSPAPHPLHNAQLSPRYANRARPMRSIKLAGADPRSLRTSARHAPSAPSAAATLPQSPPIDAVEVHRRLLKKRAKIFVCSAALVLLF